MAHIGVLCPPTSGHLNPLATLGRELQRRGHRVTVFQLPGLRDRIEQEHLGFWPLGARDAATQDLEATLARLGTLSGLSALRFTVRSAARLAHLVFTHAPIALRDAAVDLVLVDQNEPAGASVAEHLGVPFISVAAALPLNREPHVPPPFVPWAYRASTWGRVRNRLGYAAADALLGPLTTVLEEHRAAWRLPRLRSPDDSFSRRAQLSTLTRGLDFPREQPPRNFHHLGPFLDACRPAVPFPWDALDGRPIVYASFGTLQTSDVARFTTVLDACADPGVQVVLSTGGGALPPRRGGSNHLVVPFAPQQALLARATLAITHGGLNTVLEALHAAVPLVVVPVTNDQPAVAARVQWAGAGLALPLWTLSPRRLRGAVERVRRDATFRTRARAIRDEMAAAGGVRRAADIVAASLEERGQRTAPTVARVR
jgi:MGT family glycosyltransferase